ncbi:polysaccharide pyruvyl transferase family protein [Herbaspirillum sp. HC18]|nr:polysaccharide pyruvyl transferase family protein [Herbaspirillum sp. HC18]
MPDSHATILFGAFDRHNFGDLLFPHIAEALLPERKLIFAGLAERDLLTCGGHEARALSALAAEWRDRPVNIIHVGGEVLTCDAWEAAVMLLSADKAQQAISHFDAKPAERLAWAQGELGLHAFAPYTLQRALFPCAERVVYNAVGGVNLGERDPAFRDEVFANLKAADAVSVRDMQTQALLRKAGISARLIPDPAVMMAELFGARIRRHAAQDEVAAARAAFPQGYLAVQFSADFGDDATLAVIAGQLGKIAHSTGCGIVFFRAGAAPWHDDLSCFHRISARMQSASARIFTSLNMWEICALIAGSRGYLGSSLHGRIIAMAHGLPRVNLLHPSQAKLKTKQSAFAATWEEADMPGCVELHDIAHGMQCAMEANPEVLKRKSKELADQYRRAFLEQVELSDQ